MSSSLEPPGTAASASERAEATDSEIAVAEKPQDIPDFASYSYRFHIALDGNGVNGLEGMAGTCLFLYNPQSGGYAYKIRYYPGIAAGHAVAVNPGGTIGFLGNAGQHLLFYDARTLEELDRISTLRYCVPRSSLQGSTHLVWLTDSDFITAIGDFFYRFSIDSLDSGERLAPHGVKLPHAMKLSASGRYIAYGSMDQPADGASGEAKHVGIFDLVTGQVRQLDLPATCWHVLAHPKEDIFYCVSFRVAPQDYLDYHEWAMSFLKEYVFEIDIASASIRRHWSAGREVPAHINSDMCISDTELIFCNGGSQTVMCIDLSSFAAYRFIDERPDLATQFQHPREVATQVFDVLARGNVFTNSRHFLGALRVSRFSLLDSIYGCQLSRDQSLLFTANRGLNHITLYNYPEGSRRLRVSMPPIQDYFEWMGPTADPRLGFHHSQLIG